MERAFSETTIGLLFEKIVERFGREIAVVSKQQSATYRELRANAGQIARLLTANQGSDRTPVALLVGHDVPAIAGLLGAIFAGRPYCFLATGSPQTEHEFIIQDLGANVLLTDKKHEQQALALAGDLLRVVNIETMKPETRSLRLPSASASDDVVAIYYTSGSTGHPKGVIRNHRIILGRLAADSDYYQIGVEDSVALLRSLNFGATSATVFGALLNGATLNLADPQLMNTLALAEWLTAQRITVLRASTTLLRQIVDVLPSKFCFNDLRFCRPSGRLLWSDAQRLWGHLPDGCQLGHGLASTEGSLITYWELRRDQAPTGEVVPVGYGVRGVEIRLLDEAGQPVPHGEEGEIVVNSPTVSPGYWGGEKMIALKIKPDPQVAGRYILATGDLGRMINGELLEFIGRKDNQVKVRGYRVELETIEAALEKLPGVAEAAVVAVPIDNSDHKLNGYIEAQAGADLIPAELRRCLAETLPGYMVPTRLVQLDALPRGKTGKVNRKALPDPGRTRPELDIPYIKPRSAFESKLAAIWSELLEVEPIGIQDSFFDLGGQSLLAAGVASRIQTDIGIYIPLQTLYETATVAELAEQLELLAEQENCSDGEDLDLEAKLRLLGI